MRVLGTALGCFAMGMTAHFLPDQIFGVLAGFFIGIAQGAIYSLEGL